MLITHFRSSDIYCPCACVVYNGIFAFCAGIPTDFLYMYMYMKYALPPVALFTFTILPYSVMTRKYLWSVLDF